MADTSDWVGVIVLVSPVIAVMGWMIRVNLKAARQANANLATVKRIQSKYTDYKLYVSPFDLTFVGINVDLATFVVGNAAYERIYTFDQFVDAQALEETTEETRTRGNTSRSGRHYSAVSRTYRIVSRIDLKITVSDAEIPVHVVNFYHTNSVVWQELATQIDLVNKVIGYFTPILRDRRQALAAAAKDDDAVDDTADELQKLWDLCQAGALTTEEFETMKAKLLRKKR